MRKYTKEEAIRVVVSCAEKYRAELLDRSLLFICVDKQRSITAVETAFFDRNYLHLTGLKLHKEPPISAADFFRRCAANRLSPSDFAFSEDGTTHLKLEVLPRVLNKNLSARMLGDSDSIRPKLYTEKLVGGTKACVGFVTDSLSGAYVPNTVLNEDVRDNVGGCLQILAAYRKRLDEPRYGELTYRTKNKRVDWDKVVYPAPYEYIPVPGN